MRFVLDRAQTDVQEVKSADQWAKLAESGRLTSWVLLLCHNDGFPACLVGDERTKLAAAMVSILHIILVV